MVCAPASSQTGTSCDRLLIWWAPGSPEQGESHIHEIVSPPSRKVKATQRQSTFKQCSCLHCHSKFSNWPGNEAMFVSAWRMSLCKLGSRHTFPAVSWEGDVCVFRCCVLSLSGVRVPQGEFLISSFTCLSFSSFFFIAWASRSNFSFSWLTKPCIFCWRTSFSARFFWLTLRSASSCERNGRDGEEGGEEGAVGAKVHVILIKSGLWHHFILPRE